MPKNRIPPPAAAPELPPAIEPAVVLLEVVASKRPEILPWVLGDVPLGKVGEAVVRLAKEWGVPVVEVPRVADQAARYLDRLDRTRQLPEPGSVRGPDLAALFHFVLARHERLSAVRRRRHLQRLTGKLSEELELARRRRRIESFIGLTGSTG